ncbi:hypothetical protein D9611_010078 [Ephemerocybe angulata]|uniref:Uncharacterized protein n=1 Tax=Ephemerocybe angulata TaxID=980116 RepID=A0A8H5AZS7_9AGAR|nr:hypothetical protein D9611_010078 [Tulosesus angulatus]
MKLTIPSILLGLLSLSTYASAYLDYNELDARDSTNSLLVERNTVDVPFQPSLRSFLETAADAHQRALDDHDDLLGARNGMVTVEFFPMLDGRPLPLARVQVYRGWGPREVQGVLRLQYPQYSPAKAQCLLFHGPPSKLPMATLANVHMGELVILQCATIMGMSKL